MTRNGLEVSFTKDDKMNFVVRKCTDTENFDSKRRYKKRTCKRRLYHLLIALALEASSLVVGDELSYFCTLGIVTVIFVLICTEIMSLKERRLAYSSYFIEVIVNKILDTEIELYSTDFSSARFYPIEGTDTSSNYKSLLYVQETEYNNARCGEKLRIKVKGEKI